jgi:hypothetical protein
MWLAILDIEEKRAAERAKQAGKPADRRQSAPRITFTDHGVVGRHGSCSY